MIQSPCFNCTKRSIGCHGKCNAYDDYKEKLNDYNTAYRKEAESKSIGFDYFNRNPDACKKQKKSNWLKEFN